MGDVQISIYTDIRESQHKRFYPDIFNCNEMNCVMAGRQYSQKPLFSPSLAKYVSKYVSMKCLMRKIMLTKCQDKRDFRRIRIYK